MYIIPAGIPSAGLERLKTNPTPRAVKEFINELIKDYPLLITDLNRK